MRTETKLLQWSAAICTAVAIHFLLVVGMAGLNRYGAAGEGQGGIEVGLGLLGDMGESTETSDASEVVEQPPEQPREPPPPEPPEPQPEPPPPEPEPEPAQQVTEVAVQTETIEQIPEPHESEPAAELRETAPSEGGSSGEDAITQRRRSSGSGDSPRAGGSPGRQAAYSATLAAQLNREKHYPMAARRARQEGTATLSLLIRRDGSVANFSISKSSGVEALDAAVLRMLERAQPLPAFPASMTEDELRVDFPVSFSLSAL